MISRTFLTITATTWLCVEIGQFIEERSSLGQNKLFWPFWLCFVLVLVLGAHAIDNALGLESF